VSACVAISLLSELFSHLHFVVVVLLPQQHYYASNMRLVVIGAYSLDVLQKQVMESFSEVPSIPRSPPPAGQEPAAATSGDWDHIYTSPLKDLGMPFTKDSLSKVYYIAPVKDRHSLSVTWQIPSQFQNWRSKPCDYISHLLGHEAQGSMLASLKTRSWATGCYVGVGNEGYEVSKVPACPVWKRLPSIYVFL
jgi:secreted Zn-dependent insulinase-like peptidase